MKRLLLVALLGTTAFLVLGASPAAAKTPCWKKVVSDWYDNGRIDKTYAPACYREALKHLPEDVESYANARDVINRALQVAILHNNKGGGRDGGTGQGGGSGTNGAGGSGKNRISPTGPGTTDGQGRRSGPNDGLFTKALNRLGPNNADSIPLPLIILGALALLLLAAGAAGMAARKLQERRVPKPATVPRQTDGPPRT